MKIKLIALLTALLLLLTACAAPAPESDSMPPPSEGVSDPESDSSPPSPESVSDPEPEVKDVSHYYIEETSLDGIEDEEPVETLCQYLLENLTPKEYGVIDTYAEIKSPYDPENIEVLRSVRVIAPNKAPIDEVLQQYDGPYAPIFFYQNKNTLSNMTQARKDVQAFLAEHPEIEVTAFGEAWPQLVAVWVEEFSDELTSFVENYPIKGIYKIIKDSPGIPD